MSVEIQAVIEANLVLIGVGLLNTQEEQLAFAKAVDTEVSGVSSGIEVNLPAGSTAPSHQLTLAQDRIFLECSASRTRIRREYPSKKDLDRLAEIAGLAISITNHETEQLRAIGYNVDLFYEHDSEMSSLEYLGERLIAPHVGTRTGVNLTGASSVLRFESDGQLWQIRLEPRFNERQTNRIFASLNLHRDATTLPAQRDIQAALRETWRQAHRFVSKLDEGGSDN